MGCVSPDEGVRGCVWSLPSPRSSSRQHPLRRHRGLHQPGLAVHGPGAGDDAQRALCSLRQAGGGERQGQGELEGGPKAPLTCPSPSPPGEPLPPHQDPGGLLLLRVRAAGGTRGPRALLRGDGGRHDRGHLVSGAEHGGRASARCWHIPGATATVGGAVPDSGAGMSLVPLQLGGLCPSPVLAHPWCSPGRGAAVPRADAVLVTSAGWCAR